MELPMLSASQCDHTQKAGESNALLVASEPFWAAMIACQFLRTMKITHRTPDAFCLEDVSVSAKCCLGFHQLAVVDQLSGAQPTKANKHPSL